MIFFTSDLHFNHKNLVLGTSQWLDKSQCRPFNTIEEHNRIIINGINSVTSANDTLYILGDYAFGDKSLFPSFISNINCRNLILVYGNHDEPKYVSKLFQQTHKYLEIYINNQMIVMFHYPISDWNKRESGSIHLFGHCHQKFDTTHKGKMLDVSICGHNYKPWSHKEILEYMKDK